MQNQNRDRLGRYSKQQPDAITKGVGDVAWGTVQASNSVTVEGMRATYRSLTPAESYQLSIDLKKAIDARAVIARAKWRIFSRKSGREITGGDLYNLLRRPAPGWSMYRFTRDVVSNYHLGGEIAISVLERDANLTGTKLNPMPRVAGLYPLNPFRLGIQTPTTANDASEVTQWRYTWPMGQITLLGPNNIIYAANYNPLNHVRGMPPVLAGVNEISASYQAVRYNHQFFSNNAMPGHILILPKGTTQQDKEAFKNEYVSHHSVYNGQAHNVWVVTNGDGLDVKPLETPMKDAQFLELQKLSRDQINHLYMVPPVEGGMWDATKFDSVDIQREVFFESCLAPDMEMLSQVFQTQLVDRYFSASPFEMSSDTPRLSKLTKAAYERQMDESPDSDIVILLDPDTLPIAAKIKRSRVTYAQQLQDTFKISPQEAAEECGFEFQENEANTQVWHSSTVIPFTPEPEPQPQPAEQQPTALAEAETTVEDDEDTKADDDDSPQMSRAYKGFYRNLRKMILDKLDEGRLFRLAEGDEIAAGDPVLKRQVRLVYAELYPQFKNTADIEVKKQIAKDATNKPRAFFKALAKGA